MEVKNLKTIRFFGYMVVGCLGVASFSSTAFAQMQSPSSSFQPNNSSSFQQSNSFQSNSSGLSPAGKIGQNTGGFQSRPSTYQPPASPFNASGASSFSSSNGANAAKINWMNGKQFAQAQQLSKQTGKPIMLHFWNERCAPCLALERNVFPNPAVVNAINSQFIAVKVNTFETPEIHRNYGVSQWPWDVFLSPDGRKIASKQSPPTVASYTKQLATTTSMYQQFAKFAAAPTGMQNSASNSGRPSFGQSNPTFSGSNVQQTNYNQQPQGSSPTWPPSSQNSFPNQMASNGGSPNNSTPSAPSASVQNQFYKKPAPGTGSFAANPGQGNNGAPTKAISNPAANFNATASANTPVGLEGKCPVTLLKDEKWVNGSKQWGCRHRGKLYFFTSREYRDEFMTAPDKFAPVLAGYDVVEYRETGRLVEGKNSIGIFAGDQNSRQVYRFASKENMQRFKADSGRYNQAVQTAMQSANARTFR